MTFGSGRLPLIVVVTLALPPAGAAAQDTPAPRRTRFASFDVGFGGVKPVNAEWGLSYGVAFDVANLVVRGTATRFGFRFWTSESRAADGRKVDLDDSVFDFVLKKHFGPRSLGAYGGLGVGAHIIDARLGDFIDETEKRDGFHIGLSALIGAEKPLADNGFISFLIEGQAGLLTEVSNAALHAGIRIRFDRLGTPHRPEAGS